MGVLIPDVAFQFRGRLKLIEPLDFEFGLALNKTNTLGRSIGLNYHIGNWESLIENKTRSILLGADYSNVSSGVFSYQDGTISGSYLIKKNQYLSPKIGFRVYQKNVFKKNIFLNDFSLTIGVMYRFPFDNEYIVLRNGTSSPTVSDLLIKQVEGQENLFFKMTVWW